MKHKHYDCIVAWAEGKQIQYKNSDGIWVDSNCPHWAELTEYRIKPELKIKYFWLDSDDGDDQSYEGYNLRVTWDGNKLVGAEVL